MRLRLVLGDDGVERLPDGVVAVAVVGGGTSVLFLSSSTVRMAGRGWDDASGSWRARSSLRTFSTAKPRLSMRDQRRLGEIAYFFLPCTGGLLRRRWGWGCEVPGGGGGASDRVELVDRSFPSRHSLPTTSRTKSVSNVMIRRLWVRPGFVVVLCSAWNSTVASHPSGKTTGTHPRPGPGPGPVSVPAIRYETREWPHTYLDRPGTKRLVASGANFFPRKATETRYFSWGR